MSTFPDSFLSPDLLAIVAQRLTNWKQREGISVPRLARELGFKKDTLYDVVNKRRSSWRTCERIAQRMGVTVEYLLTPLKNRGRFSVNELKFSGQARHFLPGTFSDTDFQVIAEALHLRPKQKGRSNPRAGKVGGLIIRRLESLFESRAAFLAAIEEEKHLAPWIWAAVHIAPLCPVDGRV